ncbi:MAG: GAF domain-containing protein [Sphingomicrobium sp.]
MNEFDADSDALERDEQAFLSGGGECAALIAACDWSATPLGPIDEWPEGLRTTVGLVLRSKSQIVLFWGPEFIAIYNDSYAPTIGDKHPRALGRPARENWSELWDDLGPLLHSVRDSRETVFAKDRPFYIERRGYGESVYFDISYSAVPVDDDPVAGVLCIVNETTERVLAERRNVSERERFSALFEQAPGFMALLRGPDHVFELANPAYMQLIGHREALGRPVAEVLPEAVDQGFLNMLQRVYRTGEPYVGRDVEVELYASPGAPPERRFVDFVYQPLVDSEGAVTGIFVEGSDVTERTRAEALRETQNELLRDAVSNAPLASLLEKLVLAVESQSTTGVLGSILLLDPAGKRLLHGAAPNLPDAYNAGIHNTAIGPQVGSCGTAAFRKEPVFVSDIGSDPLWRDFKDLALTNGLRACWSIPILASDGRVLGTFAMYHKEPRAPVESDLELVEFVTRTASLIIERRQAEEALREETRTLDTLNQAWETVAADLDLERIVQKVTDAAVEITGAQFGAFFYNVLNEAGESFMLYSLSGVPRSAFDKFPMPRNTAVFDHTFRGLGVVRSDNVTLDPRYGKNPPHYGIPKGHLPVVSYLAVPVISRSGEVLGGLFFGHEDQARFTERHERLIVAIAAQAAIAIDNARLYSDAQREIEERRAAETRLADVTRRLDAVLNNTMMAVFVMDERHHCIFANSAAEKLIGYSFEEMSGRPFHDLVHARRPDGSDYPVHECSINKAFESAAPTKGEEWFMARDGTFFPIAFTASPVHDEASNTVGTILEVRNIAEERARAAELADALQAKEMLLHEVNHRVKNSLQVVTSLLMLQAGRAKEPALKQALLEARARIGVVAGIHQRLYSTSQHDRVDFGNYLEELASETLRSLNSSGKIHLDIDIGRELVMPLTQAVPLALVVSELITNAVKYAFPEGRSGQLKVGLRHDGDRVEIRVSDNGIGLPKDFDPSSGGGLGMRIVTALVRQVRGTLAIRPADPGAEFAISVPLTTMV